MNNFWTRAITGTVFVVVLVGAIVLGGWYMHITFGLVVLFGLLEFYGMFEKTECRPQKYLGAITGLSLYSAMIAAVYLNKDAVILCVGMMLCSPVLFSAVELFRGEQKPMQNVALTISGILYIVLPFFLLNFLSIWSDEYPRLDWIVLILFILIWTNDTFAYLTGRLIGKHKLFERISPKKTWEGFIGGIVFAIIAGMLLAYFLEDSYIKLIIYALVAGIIGTLGDLVESMLKRSVDVKDSGTILPGHGGILDRFDAVLFVVPVIFFLEIFIFN